MKKFNIGERYKISEKLSLTTVGNIIEIVGFDGTLIKYKTISGKDCDCWQRFASNSVFAKCLEPVPACSKKIVITSDGKTTTAKLYDGKQLLKSAEAKCSPDDIFDFDTGAGIVLGRITNEKVNVHVVVVSDKRHSIEAGDFVRITKSIGGALHNCTIARIGRCFDNNKFNPYYNLIFIDRDGKCNSAYAYRTQFEKVDFNLKDFRAGKIAIKVNKNNVMECINLLNELGIKWLNESDENELFNPFIYNPSREYLYFSCIPEYTKGYVYTKDIDNCTWFEKIFEW